MEAVVIGASAGAIEALSLVLNELPSSFPLPIVVVVHIPADRDSFLADIFQTKCHMRVKEAEDKEAIEPGTVYIAPPDYHLLVEKNRRLSLSSEERVMYSRPSIDVLFETAADAFEENLLGIILTGANSDGAIGLRSICEAGGTAIVQTPKSAYISTMPEAALAACPSARSLELSEISAYLQSLVPVADGVQI